MLSSTTNELWPQKSKSILKQKDVNTCKLKKVFEHIYFPWDSHYNTLRNYFSLRIQQRPLIIVKPTTIREIEYILNYCLLKSLTLRITVGRHSTQLCAPDVLIDMTFFDKKELCHDRLIAGAGNTQGQLNDFLFHQCDVCHYSHFGNFSRTEAFAGGSAKTVGSSGIATIGGIGTLKRTFGLTVDSVLSYTITLPPTETYPAKTVVCSETNHPELFWALRGGGANNFGIVSSISYKILEVDNIIEYNVTWNWSEASAVLKKWRNTSVNRPNNFNEEFSLSVSNGVKQIQLHGFYVVPKGQPQKVSRNIIEQELHSLKGELTLKKEMPYSHTYKTLVENRVYNNFSIIQALFMNKFSSSQMVRFIDESTIDNFSISFELCGGKISEVPLDETSFYPRNYSFFCDISTGWNNVALNQQKETWCNYVLGNILVEDRIAYLGFPITFDIPHTNKIYYGEHYDKLKKIRGQYDPLNLLSSCGTL